jgi:hypothetical protein
MKPTTGMATRRFPPPLDRRRGGRRLLQSFADPNGQPLAYVYSRRNGGGWNGAPLGMMPVSNRG